MGRIVLEKVTKSFGDVTIPKVSATFATAIFDTHPLNDAYSSPIHINFPSLVVTNTRPCAAATPSKFAGAGSVTTDKSRPVCMSIVRSSPLA